jgi:hypothetical protein
MIPVPISNTSIETLSATGPKIIIPNGIIVLETILKTEKTLPINACSTVVCNKTINGVFHRGNDRPIVAIITRYSPK